MEKLKNSTLLATFDYELFLGSSGHINNCLIEPTKRILDILEKYNSKATFFVDTVYLLKLKELNYNDFNTIIEQLKEIVSQGSRIELHIHPHWVDAVYNDVTNDFILSNVRYYKHSFCPKHITEMLFKEAVNMLNEIAQSIDKTYRVRAFRAGGWCIDPFSEIKPFLKECGIFIDSSVLPFTVCEVNHQSFDYRDIVLDSPYRFENNVHVLDDSGNFLEFPISIHEYNPYQKILHFINRHTSRNPYKYQGDGHLSFNLEKKTLKDSLNYLFSTTQTCFQIDGFCYIPSKRTLAKKPIWTMVGHPKTMTKKSFLSMEYLCSIMNSKTLYEISKDYFCI